MLFAFTWCAVCHHKIQIFSVNFNKLCPSVGLKKLDQAQQIVRWETRGHKPKTDQCRVERCFGHSATQSLRHFMNKPKLRVLITVSSGRLFPVLKDPTTLSQTKIVFLINHEYKLPEQDKSWSMEKNATQDVPQDH